MGNYQRLLSGFEPISEKYIHENENISVMSLEDDTDDLKGKNQYIPKNIVRSME
tara:strand:+ start:235 stop:396 length:162 start_codon:yes stop_codon:yes gene_type:complete